MRRGSFFLSAGLDDLVLLPTNFLCLSFLAQDFSGSVFSGTSFFEINILEVYMFSRSAFRLSAFFITITLVNWDAINFGMDAPKVGALAYRAWNCWRMPDTSCCIYPMWHGVHPRYASKSTPDIV